MKIAEVMSRSVVTLQPEQTLRDAVELLRSKHIRHLPVVEDGRLIGVLSRSVLQRRLAEDEPPLQPADEQ